VFTKSAGKPVLFFIEKIKSFPLIIKSTWIKVSFIPFNGWKDAIDPFVKQLIYSRQEWQVRYKGGRRAVFRGCL